jgi:hypothetical protein
MRLNRSGINNVSVGYRSLCNNTTGNRNTAIGSNSMISNTTGCNNLAVGYNSACLITTGGCNVVIGGYSVSNKPTQNCNIFISDGVGNLRMWVTGSTGALHLSNVPTDTSNEVLVFNTENGQVGKKTLQSNTNDFRASFLLMGA